MKIEDIENKFLHEVKLREYIERVQKSLQSGSLTFSSVNEIDAWAKAFFKGVENSLEALLTRVYVTGIFLSKNETAMLKELQPLTNVKNLVSSAKQQEAMEYIRTSGAVNIQKASIDTIYRTKDIVLDGVANHQSWRIIANRLQKEIREDGQIGRYWNRVAINEVNTAFNNGYIATLNMGDYVLVTGQPDACEYCKKYVIGRIFRIGEAPKGNFEDMDPTSKEYKALLKYYETHLWVGKSNFGRSPYENKIVDGKKVIRLPHEMYAPALPLHVHCRCKANRLNRKLVYVENNEVKVRTKDTEDAYNQFWGEQDARFK